MANPERQAKLRTSVRCMYIAIKDSQLDVVKECLNNIMNALQRAGHGTHTIIREVNQYWEEVAAEQ